MVSVAIVTRRISTEVERLAARLLAMPVLAAEGEVLVVAEDAVPHPTPPEPLAGASLLRIPHGRGVAYNRNRAIDASSGEVIVFLDDDCWPAEQWLPELLVPLRDPGVDAVMGAVRIPASTFLGDSISALGFPGGGSVGFEVMFHVDEDGFTNHLSTLNCALRRRVFEHVGGFDETMTAGAEDGELAHRVHVAGLRMKFQPAAVVDHRARVALGDFARWFFLRGRAACQYSRVAPAGPVIARRLSSYRRILWMHRDDPKLVAIVPLLFASVLLQQAGFGWEYASRRNGKPKAVRTETGPLDASAPVSRRQDR